MIKAQHVPKSCLCGIWLLERRHHVGRREVDRCGEDNTVLQRDGKMRVKRLEETCEDWKGVEIELYLEERECQCTWREGGLAGSWLTKSTGAIGCGAGNGVDGTAWSHDLF